jgi:hypothetical protein
LLRGFEEELATLMMFFASPHDHVLKETPVSNEFLDSMEQCGFIIPKIIQKTVSLDLLESQNQIVELNPWGWSPAELNYLSGYKQSRELHEKAKNILMHSLFERKHAVNFVHQLHSCFPAPFFPGKEQLPSIIDSVFEVENYLERHQQIVLKLPLSSSGRGLQVIRKNKLNESNKRWVLTGLKQQKYLVGEPLFNKKQDLSFQFEFEISGKINYLGTSYFSTNGNGQYLGQHLNYPVQNKEKYFSESVINDLSELLLKQLEKSIFKEHYYGFLGIDALVYTENGQTKIQPCLEINPRYNMGILSCQIENNIHPESTGLFQVYYHPSLSYKDFAALEIKKHPQVTADQKLRKGFVSLTDPQAESKFGAYLTLF